MSGATPSKLGEICQAVRGVTFRSSDASSSAFDGSVACVTTGAVQNKIDWSARRFVPVGSLRSDEQILRPGDVLISTANSKELVGKSCLIGAVPFQCAFGAFVTVLRPKAGVDSVWLSLRLRSSDALSFFFTSSSNTTGISNLRVSDLLDFGVEVPPLAEQRRIAARLTEQLAAVERARKAAEERVEAARGLDESYAAELYRRAIGAGWPMRTLAEIARADDAFADGPFGSNLKTDHYTAGGARVIRLQNVGRGRFLDHDKAFVALDHFEGLRRHEALAGDFVVAALGNGARPAGRACVVPDGLGPAMLKADCFRVRLPRDKVLPQFAVLLMNAPQQLRHAADSMRGATRPRVTLSMIRQLRIPMPGVRRQLEIVNQFAATSGVTNSVLAAAEAELAAIEALPAALLREAFGAATQ